MLQRLLGLAPRPGDWRLLSILRYVGISFIAMFGMVIFTLWKDDLRWSTQLGTSKPQPLPTQLHPISDLVAEAKMNHKAVMETQSHSIEAAASRYRERRGRHPPPGFDKWFRAAAAGDVIVVEAFFDRIYKDLTPFWALDAEKTRQRANSWHWAVRVRDGTASALGDAKDRVPWLELWTGLVGEFAEHMPDVDIPINYMDEPRILAPHETVAQLVSKASQERSMLPLESVNQAWPSQDLDAVDASKAESLDPKWHGPNENYWNLFVATCAPDSPAHGVEQISNWAEPVELPRNYRPIYAFEGYVENVTESNDACLQPHLRQLHGSFIEPVSVSSTEELIPIFGGSKLLSNNDILIPGAMYLTEDKFYSGGNNMGPEWRAKKDGVIWRGNGSGGRARKNNWHHFHRQRFVDMLNASVVKKIEETDWRPFTFELPSPSIYPSERLYSGHLGDWASKTISAAFVRLCPPNECSFYEAFFKTVDHMPMKKQYNYKFLPDVDGNSFSARFRGFLRSTSMPLKATIYAEWHDDRLMPWMHFVPFDNTYRDLYPLLDFFLDKNGPGDQLASFIAEEGRLWAERVLRREDMKLYVWRLLLEWERVCSDERHSLGYVQDLIAAKFE